jgi:hypothetical protein
MPAKAQSPSELELTDFLGPAYGLWAEIIRTIGQGFPPLDTAWKPSKAEFGRLCLLQQRKRTLLYLTPERGSVRIAIVLGERAYRLAMASSLPAAIKKMFSEAKPYAEGRGIRFSVSTPAEIAVVQELVEIKTAPK